MKKDMTICLVFGGALFGLGLLGTLYAPGGWPPILLFIGTAVVFLSSGVGAEAFGSSIDWRPSMKDEDLFIARLFVAMSWIARHNGILALNDDNRLSRIYDHPFFLRGAKMVLDGFDQDFTLDTMKNGCDTLRYRFEKKRQDVRQLGAFLLSVGGFGGISCACAFAFRALDGEGVSTGAISAAVLTILFLMGGVIAFFLIPRRIVWAYRREEMLVKQITDGWEELQRGDSYSALLMRQSTFMSEKEREAMRAMPVPEELEPLMRDGEYERMLCDVRKQVA